MRNNLFPVAKEGWSVIGYAAAAFLFFAVFDFDLFEFLTFVTIVFLIYVYRNPEREQPNFQAGSVVSPVDGLVSSIEEIEDKEYAYKVEIQSSYLDVSVLRAPMNAVLDSFTLQHGTRLSKFDPLSSNLNENAQLVFVDENSNKVKVSHMLKQSFDGIKIGAIEGQKFHQATRYGVMLNGITTLYLPQNFRLNINVGNELKASESLIGYLS